jgi:hypothetical protein
VKSVFFSYSHKDEGLRNELETHLAMLTREGVISAWHDRRLVAGDEIDSRIGSELDQAEIILLLVSPDFLASEYCYGVEVARALERHAAGEARVIPIILRPCDWKRAPFGKLLAAPTDGRPATKWPDRDDAFLDITNAIRAAAISMGDPVVAAPRAKPSPRGTPRPLGPRSSNLRVRQTFTDREKDRFLHEAFDFMASFFENSLKELAERNRGVEGDFRRIDANRFTASIYRNGQSVARCQIRLGGLGNGISFSYNANPEDTSLNESMSVEAGEQSLFLRPLGMQMHRASGKDAHLGFQGAAEFYLEPVYRTITALTSNTARTRARDWPRRRDSKLKKKTGLGHPSTSIHPATTYVSAQTWPGVDRRINTIL